MDIATDETELPLQDALIRWCDQSRLKAVFDAEGYFSERELRQLGPGYLGNPRCSVDRERPLYTQLHDRARAVLAHAWDMLIDDFQKRIGACQVYLSGTQTRPKREEWPCAIQGRWASDFEFNFFKATVGIAGRYHYVTVTGSKIPSVAARNRSVSAQSPIATITAETVKDLSDDMLLALLEEHTKRVVESRDPLSWPPKTGQVAKRDSRP